MNLGVNVVEVDGRVAPSIQPAPTSVTGFIIKSQRGIPGEVVQVTNWSQFVERFGSFMDGAFGAYAVRGFFDNGGSIAHVTRVVNTAGGTAAVAATVNLGAGPDLTVSAGYRGKADRGVWGNDLTVQTVVNANDNTQFDLIVRRKMNDQFVVVETWTGLSMTANDPRNVETIINNEFTGSKHIFVDAITANSPGAVAATPLLTGSNGSFTPANEANALAAAVDLFNLVDIQLLTCPESSANGVISAALTHCANMGDRMFIGQVPLDSDAAAAKTFGKTFQGSKVYGALYFPWIRVASPLGDPVWVPPSGHIAGVYARTERERGIWKAPAGNNALVNGALDVRHHITDVDHTDLVKNGSVNAVRYVSGQGIILDSSRTLSTNTLWLYVNVRLLFNFVKSSLKTGLRWVVQEPNDDRLWNKVKYNTVTPFLMNLWRLGAFGPGTPEQVFTVKIDGENNPPANIQQGILNVEVYFYPSRPAETIVITIGQQEGAGSASES